MSRLIPQGGNHASMSPVLLYSWLPHFLSSCTVPPRLLSRPAPVLLPDDSQVGLADNNPDLEVRQTGLSPTRCS